MKDRALTLLALAGFTVVPSIRVRADALATITPTSASSATVGQHWAVGSSQSGLGYIGGNSGFPSATATNFFSITGVAIPMSGSPTGFTSYTPTGVSSSQPSVGNSRRSPISTRRSSAARNDYRWMHHRQCSHRERWDSNACSGRFTGPPEVAGSRGPGVEREVRGPQYLRGFLVRKQFAQNEHAPTARRSRGCGPSCRRPGARRCGSDRRSRRLPRRECAR